MDLLPHLFRTEYSKITAVLCKHFGIEHIEVAEDIASETFLAALETWTYKGIPPNPTAWLYAVAKNKASNAMTRSALFNDKVVPGLRDVMDTGTQQQDVDLSEKNINDSQLQMLFALCHPLIPVESQIALALRILCGFGIEEIANAFLSNKEVINKRLHRAREKLREEKVKIEFPGEPEIRQRLDAVLTTLYLFFNEGYYSESHDSVVRKDFCLEAMRLTFLLVENPSTDLPAVNSLLALMCFHASRLDSRKSASGEMILYRDQDERLWNEELITRGKKYLHRAAQGDRFSRYHLEAGIAYWHTIKEDSKEKWENILELYDLLLATDPSPMAALNRTLAVSKVRGKEEGIREAKKLKLDGNRYYHALLGEFYTTIDNEMAKENFIKAIDLASTTADRMTIQKQLNALNGKG